MSQNEEMSHEEQVQVLFQHIQQMLSERFSEYKVDGETAEHPLYGTLFAFRLSGDGRSYSCGFFLSEIIKKLQATPDPERWICSFFYDKIDNNLIQGFPVPPESEEDAKRLLEEKILPTCIQTVKQEFPEEAVHFDVVNNEEHGPMLEVGLPNIKEGNNTCAFPLTYLYALHHLNRDASEAVVTMIYRLMDEYEEKVKA